MPKPAWMLIAIFAFTLVGCGGGPTPAGAGSTASPAVAPPPPVPAGTLFLAGGGADTDGRLASAFLGLVHPRGEGQAQLLILPTASGVPLESGRAAASDFRAIATRHAVGVVPLDTTDPARADDPLLAELIRNADGLWFTGGDPSRITQVFRPRPGTPGQPEATHTPGTPDGPALAYTALGHMLDAGGSVGGTSAGAAAMGQHMITGGRSEQALLVGIVGGGVEVAPGMGLYRTALIDQHFFERGRLGRLIVALEHTGGRWGLGIDEGKAVVATLGEPAEVTSLGADSALLVDMAQATRGGYATRTGIRLALLGDGDRWGGGGSVTPAQGKQPWAESQWPPDPQPLDPGLGAWDPGAVRDALHALAAAPDAPQVLRSRAFTLTFTADQHTMFYVRPDDRRDLCAVGVRLDITRR